MTEKERNKIGYHDPSHTHSVVDVVHISKLPFHYINTYVWCLGYFFPPFFFFIYFSTLSHSQLFLDKV